MSGLAWSRWTHENVLCIVSVSQSVDWTDERESGQWAEMRVFFKKKKSKRKISNKMKVHTKIQLYRESGATCTWYCSEQTIHGTK